jgi:hypothetical protein
MLPRCYLIVGAGVDKLRRRPYLDYQRRFDPGVCNMRPAACGRSTNPAKAAFDRNPLGGKLNGFFV